MGLPVGNALEGGSLNAPSGIGAAAVSGGVECSIDAAQQAHVHRTQNAGQPPSGADSFVPIGQVSGTKRELTPLASARSTASTAIKNARRMLVNISVHRGARWYVGRVGCFDTRRPAVSNQRRNLAKAGA
jgi:hypothetical protein